MTRPTPPESTLTEGVDVFGKSQTSRQHRDYGGHVARHAAPGNTVTGGRARPPEDRETRGVTWEDLQLPATQ